MLSCKCSCRCYQMTLLIVVSQKCFTIQKGHRLTIDGSCLHDTQGGSRGEIMMTSTKIYAGASTRLTIQKGQLQEAQLQRCA
jgi:hypothetical protein